MENILVTGGAGFIGSNLVLKLVDKGYNVTVLDNLSPQIHTDNPESSELYLSIKGRVRFIKGDITIKKDWIEALTDQHCIVHLAAETGTGQSMYEIERYTSVNIQGTAILLDLLANTKHFVKRVIIASSRSIYGEGKYHAEELGIVYPSHRSVTEMDRGNFNVTYPGCIKPLSLLATDESSKIHPSSVYGITKQVQEQLVMTVCPTIGITPVAFRYQNVYGPGQSLSNPYTGILSIFSTLIRANQAINIFEDGNESRDFVFIDDVVDATIKGIEMNAADNEIFNVGYGRPVSVLTVAKTLIDQYGISVPLQITGNYRLGDIRHNYADLKKIKSMLNFEPKYEFDRGISKFCNWVKKQAAVKSTFGKSIEELKERGLIK